MNPLNEESTEPPEPAEGIEQIAVIGMAGIFPGAPDLEAFWDNLCAGVESIERHSAEDLRRAGVPEEWIRHPRFVPAGTSLDGFDCFDAGFFGYSPREALWMDPQQRLFLEVCWHALEDAGYPSEADTGPIGVFAGSSPSRYRERLQVPVDPSEVAARMEVMIGNESDYLATRVAYKLNLHGPALTVQTACSTSLTAVHLACQSLLTYQCNLALAGGASVDPERRWGYFYQEGAILSPDGHCRAFDARANGTVVGQGVGAVVLKRLSEALADGDTVYAVIRGSAVNNDGSGKIGYTAPSVSGQVEVIALAQAVSGVSPETLSYIEAHGTGTRLGDPIEVAALTQAFRATTTKKNFCALGSVKTNIGHADAAAGIAGLIKTVLMLRHKKIPPSLHFQSPNPEIDFAGSPFFVPTRLLDWTPPAGGARRAGVSSLGIGGTNVHVILEEASERPPAPAPRPCEILLLSARTPDALDAAAQTLARHLRKHPGLCLADVAFTLAVGRRPFRCRRSLVAAGPREAAQALGSGAGRPQDLAPVEGGGPPRVVFMFTGQGAQYPGMGKDLYRGERLFRETVDDCCRIVDPLLGLDLKEVMMPAEAVSGGQEDRLNQTALAQPALFILEYALARLWMSWGVKPDAMVGHSIGEYVAACLAGVFDLETALSLVCARGRLMQEMAPGAMLAVQAGEDLMRQWGDDRLELAAVNAPDLCVVSGDLEAIQTLEARLQERGVGCKRLVTSHAFHSRLMEDAAQRFAREMAGIRLHSPKIPFLSNLTGSWIRDADATRIGYWAEHLRRTVRFSDCMTHLLEEPRSVLLEIGPGRTLATLARRHVRQSRMPVVLSSLRHPHENRSDGETVLTALGKLWEAGIEPDWKQFYRGQARRRVPLPGYPFERRRCWPENDLVGTGSRVAARPEKPGDAPVREDSIPAEPLFQGVPSVSGTTRESGIESRLKAIWKRLLGVESIAEDDDFFDLGGSSLLAVRLFSDIEKEFQRKLPLATLLEASTLAKLAAVIADRGAPETWTPVVALRREGRRPPFFCVHAAGGNVLMYRDLARHLGGDQPFYGIQSQGLDGRMPFLTRIEDMASLYVREIRRVQPQGPYLLGGYCMGGTIAYEMACQLREAGESVSLLALFETYNWSEVQTDSKSRKLYFYLQKVEFHARNLLLAENAATFLREKINVAFNRKGLWLESIRRRLAPGNGAGNLVYDLWRINDAAAIRYRARPYDGKVTFFRPQKQYALLDTREAGWEGLARGGIDTRVLDVFPAGMLVEPFVKRTAEILTSCIEEALA